MRHSLLSAVLSLSVLLSTLVAAQDASYTFTTIDVPDDLHTLAEGINDSGQIVGSFSDGTKGRGFVTDGDTFTPIDVPGSRTTSGHKINDSGQVVGSSMMMLRGGTVAL